MNKNKRYSKKKFKMPFVAKVLLTLVGALLMVVLIVMSVAYSKWRNANYLRPDMFQSENKSQALVKKENVLDDNSVEKDESPALAEGVISFEGKRYRYNDNLVNVLILGIDNDGEASSEEEGIIEAHQADSIVLGTIDAIRREISFINIPRDTVTDVRVLDFDNAYVTTEKAPIAVQHSYGSQGKETNEATVSAVANLLYDIPIYRYSAIDMAAIPIINDSVGGVTVEILEDLTKWDASMTKGTVKTLVGHDATIYICRRDTSIDDSPIGRMKRQTQYLNNMFDAVKNKTREDITFPVKTFLSVESYVDTNLSLEEISYLAKQMMEMQLNTNTITTIPGQMREIEEGEYEGYIYKMGYVVDEEALKRLIIDRFYVEVE